MLEGVAAVLLDASSRDVQNPPFDVAGSRMWKRDPGGGMGWNKAT